MFQILTQYCHKCLLTVTGFQLLTWQMFFQHSSASKFTILFCFLVSRENLDLDPVAREFHSSPSIFNAALKDNFDSLLPPGGGALLQYVDDLIICSPTKGTWEKIKHLHCCSLAENGHKVSLTKLQLISNQVTFLQYTAEGKSLSPKRVEAFQNIPKHL